jgi:hypothetical protein
MMERNCICREVLMELQLVQTEGIAVAEGAVWKECYHSSERRVAIVTTAVEGRWP